MPCESCEFVSMTPTISLLRTDNTELGFGGGVLAHKQSKEVGKFYDLEPQRDTPMDVFAHNTTTIRNLAEIRYRELVPPVETQYEPLAPMHSLLTDPAPPLLEPVRSPEVPTVVADIRDIKRPKAVSLADLRRGDAKGKAPEGLTSTAQRRRASLKPFTRSLAADQPGPSSSESSYRPPSDEGVDLQPASGPAPIIELEPDIVTPDGKPAREAASWHPSKFAGRFRRSKTSSDESPTGTKRNAEPTETAQDVQHLPQSIPEIRIGEGPVSEEEREEISSRYQALLEAGVSDPLTMLKAAAGGEVPPIIELPPAPTHFPSEDTHDRLHSLATDALVPSSVKKTASHTLAHDKAIDAQPSLQRAHRLSADVTTPVQTPGAPGHHLDADPTVATPRQLFSHELLDDTVVQRQPKSPQPHRLDSDKVVARAQKDRQAHGLGSDKKILAAQRQPQSHRLDTDKVVPGMAKSKPHELDADRVIVPKASAAHAARDLSHDVRILSPSGRVRDPHSMSSDELASETTAFRKSPHPDAMPGHYAHSSSSADNGENEMVSLNESIQNANKALSDLSRALEGNELATMAPSGQGFWGRVFGRREGLGEGQTTGLEEGVRNAQEKATL